MGWFDRIREGLKKTREGVFGRLRGLFGHGEIDDGFYEELEEVLILGDVGMGATEHLMERIRSRVQRERLRLKSEVLPVLREEMIALLGPAPEPPNLPEERPSVWLMVGVNGAGKTTSIAKLAHRYRGEGKRVLVAAGDTFRAAAQEQLLVWAERAQVEVIRHGEGADPAAVVFDAVEASFARRVNLLLVDTAGRLHTKQNLMKELEKIGRIIRRRIPEGADETLLVVDATTGQNGLRQAQEFARAVSLTGIVLTKLDGTAKGGIVLAIARELGVPVRFVGFGERMEDLRPFEPTAFVEALLEGLDRETADR